MPLAGCCPFWQYEKDGVCYCQGAELRFPSKEARRRFVYPLCGSVDGFQSCRMFQALSDNEASPVRKHRK